MVISKFSRAGTYHRDIKRKNQDYLYSVEGEAFLAIMLADGATACEKGWKEQDYHVKRWQKLLNKRVVNFFINPREKMAIC